MKWALALALLFLAHCRHAQAGIFYTDSTYTTEATSPNLLGGSEVYSKVSEASFPPTIQSYTLTLTFAAGLLVPDATTIGGTLTLLENGKSDSFSLSSGFTHSGSISTDNGTAYTTWTEPVSSGGELIGQNPNATWQLYLNNTAGITTGSPDITGWSLDITAVPEPVNVALGIFGGVFVVGGFCGTQPVRNRLQRCWAGVNHWLDAV